MSRYYLDDDDDDDDNDDDDDERESDHKANENQKIFLAGSPGHGSMFVQNSAGAKARIVIDK